MPGVYALPHVGSWSLLFGGFRLTEWFEQTLGDGEGQGNLTCCSPLGHKESGMTL